MITEKNLTFRYDINALRAIAVTAVIFYHYKFAFLGGGFAGVDIFFVISGFLMTKIILAGLSAGDFSWSGFLLKRAHRIIPALLVMVSVVTLIELGLCFPWQLKSSAQSGLTALLFFSNLKFVRHAGYFDPGSATNVYLHTWSLSVEFQFYLLYPVLLMALRNTGKYLVRVLAGITLISFGLSVWLTSRHPDVSFYILPTRGWELLAGGLAFFAGKEISGRGLKAILAGSSFLVLLSGLFLLKPEMKWPGYFTLVPVLATAVIIAAGQDFRFLRASFIQYTGKISYSLYLWHWPVLVIAPYLGFQQSVLSGIILIAISFVLASFSFAFVESSLGNTKKMFSVLALVCMVVFICSFLPVNAFLFKAETLKLGNFNSLPSYNRAMQFSEGKCFVVSDNAEDFKRQECLKIVKGRKNFLLLGDSHAAELSQSLRTYLLTKNASLLQSTASICLPLLERDKKPYCDQLNRYIYEDFLVHHHADIDGVILDGYWAEAPDREAFLKDLDATLKYLHKLGIRTIVIGQTEFYSVSYSEIAAREYQYGMKLRERYIESQGAELNAVLKGSFPASYIDIYCTGPVPPVQGDKVPYYSDDNHYSLYGADLATLKIFSDPVGVKFLGL